MNSRYATIAMPVLSYYGLGREAINRWFFMNEGHINIRKTPTTHICAKPKPA
jgi:hypothetical protein